MVHSCFVRSCKNRGKLPGISYHEFPKSNFKAWFQVLNRSPDKMYSLKNVICSDHFDKNDFVFCDTLRKLKPGVVPSLFLKTAKCKDQTNSNQLDGIEPHGTSQNFSDTSNNSSTDSDSLYAVMDVYDIHNYCSKSLEKYHKEFIFVEDLTVVDDPLKKQETSSPSTSTATSSSDIF